VKRALFKQDGQTLVHQVAEISIRDQNPQWKEVKEAQKLDNFTGDTTINGIVYFEGLMYLPQSLRQKYILQYHESPLAGHARPEVVYSRLKDNFYFPHMRQEVFKTIGKCVLCRKAKYERHKPYGLLQPNQPPEGPWRTVSMDFIGPLPPSPNIDGVLFEHIMVIVDRLTKYSIFIPMPKGYDAKYTATVFERDVVSKHGIPDSIISDRDTIFTSHFWEELCQMLGIERRLSTAYHPQTDGQTERMNQTLEQYLRIYVNDEQDNWVSLLPNAAFAYNATVQNTTKMSPFFANFGREPQFGIEEGNLLPTEAIVHAEELRSVHKQLSSDITFLNKRMAAQANKKRIVGPILQRGDKVYLWRRNIKTKRASRKLDFLKLGPYKIKNVKGPVNYELELPANSRIHPVFHISLLEPANPETPLDKQNHIEHERTVPEYEVEKVLDHAVIGRQHKYLIKWLGYPTSENTWEPMSHLKNSLQLLWEFHLRNPEHPSPPNLSRQVGRRQKNRKVRG
jgi:transposase InsO family protein